MKTVVNGIEKKLTKLLTKVRKVFPHAEIERIDLFPTTKRLKPNIIFVMDCRPNTASSVLEYTFTDGNYYYSGDFYKHLKDLKKAYENDYRPKGKEKIYKITAYKDGTPTQVITKMEEV